MENLTVWPSPLLTQNSELREAGVYNWTIPAHVVTLSDGTRFNTCPHAGFCGTVCYAKFNMYRFRTVHDRHVRNLEFVLRDPDLWQLRMVDEIAARRFWPTGNPLDLPHDPNDPWLARWVLIGGKAVRIHDAGDFFDVAYLRRWFHIARQNMDVLHYAYTKEVTMLRELAGEAPPNFRVVFSFGGTEDHLIDRDRDRHADVFPDDATLQAAGYFNQEANDLLAVTAPTTRIGIVANNIPVAVRRFAGRPMSAARSK